MSISSIFSGSATSTTPANTVGPTLNAKDPASDPTGGDPSAIVSISGQAKQLSAPYRGRNPRADSPAPHRGRNPRAAGPPTPGASSAASAVSSAIAAYRQASVKSVKAAP